jgi:fused signal recognition particle receptor
MAAGKKCLLAAADTYRAAAAEQLELWANKLGVEMIRGTQGSDPGAVVYSAVEAAVARNVDVLIIDSSGRMHTQHNLMAELKKLDSVAKKIIPEAPHQILLVLDSTTGQNGLSQAKAFSEAVEVTGVVLAKLDSSSKGGIAFSIRIHRRSKQIRAFRICRCNASFG